MYELIEDSIDKQALLQGGHLCYSCIRLRVVKIMPSFSMHQERDLLILVKSTSTFTHSSTFFFGISKNIMSLFVAAASCHRVSIISNQDTQFG